MTSHWSVPVKKFEVNLSRNPKSKSLSFHKSLDFAEKIQPQVAVQTISSDAFPLSSVLQFFHYKYLTFYMY